jgi:hypothetical protein
MGANFSGLDNNDSQLLQTWLNRVKDVQESKSLIKQQHDEQKYFTKRQLRLQERGVIASERASPSEITIQLRNLVLQFIEKAIPYVILMLFLVCLYLLFTGGFSSSSKSTSKSNSVAEMLKYEQMIKSQFTGFFGSIYLYFYKIWSSISVPPQINRLLNTFNQYNDGGPTVPRTVVTSGRCDNIKWIENTGDGKMGTCTSTIRPQDLTWKLDSQLNSEFRSGSFQDYAKANGLDSSQWVNNTNVIIPWDRSPETTFFVPQCEQAYFANQCRSEANKTSCKTHEQWADGYCCAKANLLKEQGLTCGLASFTLGSKTNQTYNDDISTDPEFENINKINKKKFSESNLTGSPNFIDLVRAEASSAASAFLYS